MDKEQKTWLIVTIFTVTILILIFAGITYAYFTSNDNTGSTAQIITDSGKMIINYADGNSALLISTNISPSNNIIIDKTFTLTGLNTSTAGSGMRMPYRVGFNYISTFSDEQIHYYIKRITTNSNVISTLIGTSNQTIPGNQSETGYTTGTLKKGNRYQELATGEFTANKDEQTITFNLKFQFPDTNTNQDSEKGKSLTGNIVVNYEESATDTLIAKYDTETKANGVSTSGLFIDSTEDVNLRYTGSNPTNYVEFANTGELWRIVGIFNVTDSNGVTNRNIKLVRDTSLGTYSWDATGNNDYGINDWSEADLMQELNGDYLNINLTANKTNWYNSYWDSTNKKPVFSQTGVFDYTKVVKVKYQNMINNSVWNIGGNIYSPRTNPFGLNLLKQYIAERGTTTYNNSNATVWTGKIGLIYASDYGFASTSEECHNDMRAGVTYDKDTNMYDYTKTICKNDNWLAKNSQYWTLSPYHDNLAYLFNVHSDGAVGHNYASNAHCVYPSVYLKSNINFINGDGTKNNPYILG